MKRRSFSSSFTPAAPKQTALPNAAFNTVTKVFFSEEYLRNRLTMFQLYTPDMQRKRQHEPLVSFHRQAANPERIVLAQSVDSAKGALQVKRDIRKEDAYAAPVATLSFKNAIDLFGTNYKDVSESLHMIETVQDVREYLPGILMDLTPPTPPPAKTAAPA